MKDLDKFIENPEQLKFSKIKKIMVQLGFDIRQAKGSHIIFYKKGVGNITMAIHNGDCKNIYKKACLKTLKFHKIIK